MAEEKNYAGGDENDEEEESDHVLIEMTRGETGETKGGETKHSSTSTPPLPSPPAITSAQRNRWQKAVANAKQGLRQLSDPGLEARREKRSQQADSYISSVVHATKDKRNRSPFVFTPATDETKSIHIPFHLMLNILRFVGDSIPFLPSSFVTTPQFERRVGSIRAFDSYYHRNPNFQNMKQNMKQEREYMQSTRVKEDTNSIFFWGSVDGKIGSESLALQLGDLFGDCIPACKDRFGRLHRSGHHQRCVHYVAGDKGRLVRAMAKNPMKEDSSYQLQIKCHLIRFWNPGGTVMPPWSGREYADHPGRRNRLAQDLRHGIALVRRAREIKHENKKICQQVLKKEFNTLVSRSGMCRERDQAQLVITEQLNDSNFNPTNQLQFNKDLGGQKYPTFKSSLCARPVFGHQEAPVFVRDVVSLSKLRQVSNRMRELVADTVWGEHEQTTLREFHKEFQEISTEMNKCSTEITKIGNELEVVISLSDNLNIAHDESMILTQSLPFLCLIFILVAWLGTASIEIAMEQFNATQSNGNNSTNSSTNGTNGTNSTNGTNGTLNGTTKQVVFQGVTMSQVHSYNLIIAALVFSSVAVCVCLVRCVRVCLPLCRWRRTMWQCCCGIGVAKTWKILKRTYSQQSRYYETKYEVSFYWFLLLTIGLAPELTLIRAFLWSRLTIEERNVGTMSEVLFPLWPFFIIPAVSIPAFLSRLLSKELLAFWWPESSLPFHCLVGGGFVISIVFYVLKFDGILDYSLFSCSIPLFVSSAMLCFYSVYKLFDQDLFRSGCIPIVCCLVPIIMTVVSLLIVKYDDDIIISLYIFPAIVSGLVCCTCCSIVAFFSLSGWGSS